MFACPWGFYWRSLTERGPNHPLGHWPDELSPPSGAGDTLLGRAIVVTVAEQRADRRNRDHYLARQRLEEDTLEWDLVRSGERWTVCNGVQFGFHQPEDATTWFPLGASRATARRLADSVYRQWRGKAP